MFVCAHVSHWRTCSNEEEGSSTIVVTADQVLEQRRISRQRVNASLPKREGPSRKRGRPRHVQTNPEAPNSSGLQGHGMWHRGKGLLENETRQAAPCTIQSGGPQFFRPTSSWHTAPGSESMLVTLREDRAKEFLDLLPNSKEGPIFVVITGLLAKKFSDATSLSSTDATRCYVNIDYPPLKNLKDALTSGANEKQQALPPPTVQQFVTSTGDIVHQLPITTILETVIPPGTQEAKMDVIPPMVRNIISKDCAFQIKITPCNIIQGCEEYTVTRVSGVAENLSQSDMSSASTDAAATTVASGVTRGKRLPNLA